MKALTKTQIAAMNGKPLFLNKVKSVSDGMAGSERVVKESTNSKLSKEITAPAWKDAKIYTVTLEERATCNRACLHWDDCYGNNMRNAVRYVADDALIRQMENDLAHWQARTDKLNAKRSAKGLEPVPFVVRLHVLGDFFSVGYVAQWAKWFGMFPSLRAWGYSHWNPGTEIGDALLSLREALGGLDARQGARFCIRFSDHDESGAGAMADTNPKAAELIDAGQAFICPEQTQSEERKAGPNAIHCGNCGLCWMSKKHVIFQTH
jgi:hypothetical protein